MAKSKKSLAETHPELSKEWHPTLNVIQPTDVTFGSNKKVWWKCPEGDDHEWIGKIAPRASGNRCPICTGKITVLSTSLYHVNPEVASEWHPTKNGKLSPKEISPKSNKKVWWQCSIADDHMWSATVAHRSNGTGCPYCSNRRISKTNSLNAKFPELASKWHPTKNGSIHPENIIPTYTGKVWWKCPKGEDHEWQRSPTSIIRNIQDSYDVSSLNACPYCTGSVLGKANSIVELYPEIAKQWHPTRNGRLNPYDFTHKSTKKIWWKCDKGDDHEWETSIYQRALGSGCLVCSGHLRAKSTSLGNLFPQLAKQWHPIKNGDLTPFDIAPGSSTKVWWKCTEGEDHEWESSPNGRRGCPVCANQKIVRSNSLAFLRPDLANEWHQKKNGTLTPLDFGISSSKKVWWKCPKGEDHEWKVSINNRNLGKNCPVCANLKVVNSNCLNTTSPHLAKEWHQEKNGTLTPFNIVQGSRKKIWWKCSKDANHVWRAYVYSRTLGNGCPYCTLTPQSKQELIITFELKTLFNRIDPKGFKTRLDDRLRAIDIFIPKLNLCLEFDGSYWHKGKREIDKIKSNLLLKEGYSVIRVREEPLKKIHDTDVVSKQPYDGKQVTDDILSMILSMYELNSELVQRIKDYQSKGELQNEKGLNRYIDKILKEKAEKK
jgi:DNA-directed RNA polymerase subunit RPC12/RpoP